MDIKLAEMFDGEYVRNNDGTHLDGDIADCLIWQEIYKRIIVYPLSQYDLLNSKIGRYFASMLSSELDRVGERK